MHNGVFYTLEEVVDFYNAGGMDEEGRTTLFPENKSALIKPLGLSDEEKDDPKDWGQKRIGVTH